jgi:hypothetical protein
MDGCIESFWVWAKDINHFRTSEHTFTILFGINTRSRFYTLYMYILTSLPLRVSPKLAFPRTTIEPSLSVYYVSRNHHQLSALYGSSYSNRCLPFSHQSHPSSSRQFLLSKAATSNIQLRQCSLHLPRYWAGLCSQVKRHQRRQWPLLGF